MPPKTAVYCRVSTEEQALEGYSIDAQKEILENYCVAQDYEIWAVYVDDGFSGRSTNRPAYRRMMEEIDRWDIMLVLKMDRIHRNSRNFMNMMDTLGRKHKEFVSATESLDTTNAMGRFVMAMIQNIAQLESEQIGERTYMGMRQKAETMSNTREASRTMGMNPPYGYVLEDGLLRSVPEELAHVREVFAYCSGGMSQAAAAEALNRDGVRTRRGSRWTAYSIGSMVHNPIYAGYMRWNGVLYRHYAGTAVSPADFNELQRLAASRERDPSKKKDRLTVPEDDWGTEEGAASPFGEDGYPRENDYGHDGQGGNSRDQRCDRTDDVPGAFIGITGGFIRRLRGPSDDRGPARVAERRSVGILLSASGTIHAIGTSR